MRSSLVLSPDSGGVFDVLLRLVRLGLGGAAGSGKQYVSWVHYVDFIAAIRWIIDNKTMNGITNIASPNPLPNGQFMKMLWHASGVSIALPAAEWMLEAGAIFLNTETELILKSRRVIPGRLLNSGFQFQYPEWRQASSDLCARWRHLRQA